MGKHIILSELIFDPSQGHDVPIKKAVEYDPSEYKTKEEAAKAFRLALIEYAIDHQGFTRELAESEISCWPPQRTKQYSGEASWCVVWESGPYQWAIPVSMQMRGPWGYCEPYYSFDLHFTE